MCNIYNYIGLTECGGKIKEGKSIAKGVTRTLTVGPPATVVKAQGVYI